MAEPLAAGVLGSLMLPRAAAAASRSNALARVARSSGQISLAANFFTPVPRQSKGKRKSTVDESLALGHILDCQAWACPPSKDWLWCHGGSMRNTLLEEIEPIRPPRSGARIRKNSKSSRSRFKSLAPQKRAGIQHSHNSYSTSCHLSLKPEPSTMELNGSIAPSYNQPVASTSSAVPMSYFHEYLNLLATQFMSNHLPEYTQAFIVIEESDAFHSASFPEVLNFAELLAHQIDLMCVDVMVPETISKWGNRLWGLHSVLQERLASSSTSPRDSDRVDSLLSRAFAFMGEPSQAEYYLLRRESVDTLSPKDGDTSAKDASKHDTSFDHAFRSYALSISVHQDISTALECILTRRGITHRQCAADLIALLKDPVFGQLMTKIHNIRAVLASTAHWKYQLPMKVADTLVSSLNSKQAYSQALQAIKEIHQRSISYPRHAVEETCKGLVSSGLVDESYELLAMFSPQTRFFKVIHKHIPPKEKPPDQPELRTRFNPTDRTARIIQTFDNTYPQGADGIRMKKPDLSYYNYLLQAFTHKARPEMDNVQELLEDMARHGLQPNVYMFTNIINAYKALGNADGIISTFEGMRNADVKGDAVLYTTLISWFAKRMDPETASALYTQAIEQGVVPDEIMNDALMFAHARSGSWKEVIRLFKHIKSLAPNGRPAIGTYNIVLKASMFCGAPFKTISKLFFKLEEKGVEPDKYTYAILIQSAIAHHRLDYAREVYNELVRREKETGKQMIDVAILTLMMAGYMGLNHEKSAKDMLNEMKKRGIEPNAITFGTIARSYGMDGTLEGLRVAEEFVAKLGKETAGKPATWDVVANARQRPLASVYGPLVAAHAKKGNVAGAERACKQFIDAGGEPSIALLNSLLTVYRDAKQIDKVLELWPVLRDVAVRQSILIAGPNNDAGGDINGKGRGIQTKMAVITVPLSTFTQAASEAGYHAAVMDAWMDLKKHGHLFDEGNWNDYVLACVRAGQVERAFKVVERVLLPPHRKSRANYITAEPPLDAPFEEKMRVLERMEELPMRNPVIAPRHRTQIAERSKRDSVQRNTRLFDEDAMLQDFAYPLQTLRVVNPRWKTWHPHERVLKALLICVEQLQEGYPIRATFVGETTKDDVATTDVANFSAAELLLATIYDECSATMEHLDRFKQWELTRHGLRAFRQIYTRR